MISGGDDDMVQPGAEKGSTRGLQVAFPIALCVLLARARELADLSAILLGMHVRCQLAGSCADKVLLTNSQNFLQLNIEYCSSNYQELVANGRRMIADTCNNNNEIYWLYNVRLDPKLSCIITYE